MKQTITILLAFLFPLLASTAQELPQGCFRNPMEHDIGLSATFAEFRVNHFHAGLDMRTGGEVGRPVYAAADGYVAKVSISAWGGGKILYIAHPALGYNTVYMHLDGYAGEIGKAVLKEQYAQHRYGISKVFAPNELPVRKGQLVARSGNSGGSGGPHLHFEVRRGGLDDLHTHATTINPLRFGIPYRDSVKPVVRGLRLYPVGGDPVDLGTAQEVTAQGPFYLGVYATDAAEGSTARNGVDRMEVYVDGALFFMYTTDEFPLDSSRISNALIDFQYYRQHRQAYVLTRRLPGAEGPWIPVRQGDGIMRFEPGTTHRVRVKVYDIKGNGAQHVLTVHAAAGTAAASSAPRPAGSRTAVRYDQPLEVQSSAFSASLKPYTFYADDSVLTAVSHDMAYLSPRCTIEPVVNQLPPNVAFSLGIKESVDPGADRARVTVVRIDGTRLTAYKTTYADGVYSASVRDFGTFALTTDKEAPKVKPVNFSEGKPLRVKTLRVKISDNLSGIETYDCYLNGEWVLAEHDGKSATLSIDAGGRLTAGTNRLRVVVSDACGNQTDVTYTLSR